MQKYNFPIIIEKDEDGYVAFCPSLKGCQTQADSYDDILARIKEAIELYLEDFENDNFDIKIPELTSLA